MLSEEDIATLKYYGDNYKNISPKCPVLIPSYKNREDSRIRHLETVSDNKIMIFVWDWDSLKRLDNLITIFLFWMLKHNRIKRTTMILIQVLILCPKADRDKPQS